MHSDVPTLVLATGVGIERVPHRETARALYFRDPYGGKVRAQSIALRKQLADALVAAGRKDLVDPLESAVPWLWLSVPPSIDQNALHEYTALTSGDQKTPAALFALPPTTW